MSIIKGGSFIIETIAPDAVFTPEDFTDEHKLIAKTAADFAAKEVEPVLPELEAQKENLMADLLKKAGEVGLLSIDIPEEYGGTGMDKASSMLVCENLARGGCFVVGHGAHTGIGTLPIVFFGNKQQKQKYLPALASGEKLAAYALTEPGSGSDALAAKTRAVLSEDGRYYILNGTKQFITNASFADVFITYAKVDGEKFTAFIVDRDSEGVSTGPEEHKMGIKGSSTRTLILEDAKVPVENVLGEIGRGHVVAFNILNIGRFKLAAGALGNCKLALELAVKYAKERRQFGQPIAGFGMIKEKLAEMAIQTYMVESVNYRTAGLIDEILAPIDKEAPDAGLKTAQGIEEYAIECSINKVAGSEALDFTTDEAVQIFGGYGYIAEYPVERMYRDSRINRIFEGTNEINRLLIPGTLMRRAMKGEIPLLEAAQRLKTEMLAAVKTVSGEALEAELGLLEQAKKLFLLVAGSAAQKFAAKLINEQEILANLADMIIDIFAMESVLLRATKHYRQAGSEKAAMQIDLARVFTHDAFDRIEMNGRESLAAIEAGDMLRTQLSILKKLSRHDPVNTVAIRRRIADRVIEAERYAV
ncbi:MAG: acyl-CoA dehydrogenase family protein [Syntrophomonadaceae bacterium]|nr:acyl-CoA dehydrogenase family protein [Syntrophomonadaceae bacterium]